MSEHLEELIESLNLEVVEEIQTLGRKERRRKLPSALLTGNMPSILQGLLEREDLTVWEHQAQAMDHLVNRRNVVVSTGTASGKSLVFQIEALRHLTSDISARILVIYPLKALASDQFGKWKNLARTAGFAKGSIGRIDGNVPMQERDTILATARVLIMTPDVCHAWFMRNVGSGPVKRFVEELRLLVLDEAHIYESVFGSNAAFLMRRLIAAKKRATRGDVKSKQFQVVATTATVSGPSDHLRKLTGLDFAVVDEDQAQHPHFSISIACPMAKPTFRTTRSNKLVRNGVGSCGARKRVSSATWMPTDSSSAGFTRSSIMMLSRTLPHSLNRWAAAGAAVRPCRLF